MAMVVTLVASHCYAGWRLSLDKRENIQINNLLRNYSSFGCKLRVMLIILILQGSVCEVITKKTVQKQVRSL